MPTDKRARQKEGKAARREALLEAQRKQGRRRRIVRFFIPVAILVAAAVFLSNRGDDTETVATDASTTTAKGAATADTLPKSDCPPAAGAEVRKIAFAKAPAMCIDVKKTYVAEVKTNKGDFTITLDAKRAPKTVNNFVFLARNKFYDGVKFHRIIPGFVVQGGDPQGTGQGGPGYQFADELPKEGDYKVGSLAMANSGPDTNGSQFFVVTGPEGAQLPPKYSLFGTVTAGLDTTVKALEAVGTPGAGTPSEEVSMISVRITEQ